MKTKLCIIAAGLLLTAISPGFGQPVITQQPQLSTNVAGTTAMFSVQATGTPPLAYQWQANAGALDFYALTGCTNETMVVTNVQTSHVGDYRVVITNVDGAITSALALLTVVVPPRITPPTSLQHQVARIGTAASFAVSASGTAPLAYQWRLDGQELELQTNRILHFGTVQLADEGDYTVVVTNLAGAVTSAPARLWVVPPASGVVKSNFTNNLGRLPYCYVLPTDYDAGRYYPLWLSFHGSPADETMAFPSLPTARASCS